LPFPWPDVGDSSDIQLACDDAVQAHSGCVDTLTVPVPPLATTELEETSRETPHFGGVGPVDVVEDEAHPLARIAVASASPSASRTRNGGRPVARRRDAFEMKPDITLNGVRRETRYV
jgi:hypothetical protein